MPVLRVNGTELYYEDSGGSGEPVVFSHSLLWSGELFEAQVQALRGRYRCIVYDHRGQGRSAVPSTPAIDVETLYEDAVQLIEQLAVGPCHFVGLQLGGFLGMRLAARRPDLLRTLTLLETSPDPEPPEKVSRYRTLSLVARFLGVGVVVDRVMPILFGRTFLTDPARAPERALWRERLRRNRRSIWRAVNGFVARQGVAGELPGIRVPTLVVVGEEDVATVPARAERIHALIPGSRLVRLPRCGHTSPVEEPGAVSAALAAFLAESPGVAAQRTA